MKERAIICIILLVVACAVCGCEDEQPLNEWHWDVMVKEKRAEGYHIVSITMQKKDADYITIIDGNYSYELSDPNQANYTERLEVGGR